MSRVWEYKVVSLPFAEANKEEELLNRLGQERWELVSVQYYNNNTSFYYLKRPY